MKILVNTKKVYLLGRIASTFGTVAMKRRSITEVHMNPMDFYKLRITPDFYQQFDSETHFGRIKSGIVGYLWGSVVKLDVQLKSGEVRFTTTVNVSKKAAAIAALQAA